MARETMTDVKAQRDDALARAAHAEAELIRLQSLLDTLRRLLTLDA